MSTKEQKQKPKANGYKNHKNIENFLRPFITKVLFGIIHPFLNHIALINSKQLFQNLFVLLQNLRIADNIQRGPLNFF